MVSEQTYSNCHGITWAVPLLCSRRLFCCGGCRPLFCCPWSGESLVATTELVAVGLPDAAAGPRSPPSLFSPSFPIFKGGSSPSFPSTGRLCPLPTSLPGHPEVCSAHSGWSAAARSPPPIAPNLGGYGSNNGGSGGESGWCRMSLVVTSLSKSYVSPSSSSG